MTRDEFLERHRHEMVGIVIDAASVPRAGGEMALWLRTMMRRIDLRLTEIYKDCHPEKRLPNAKWLEAFPPQKTAQPGDKK